MESVIELNGNGEPLDCSEDAGTRLENYSTTIFSFLPIDLLKEYSSEQLKEKGIEVIYANRDNFNGCVENEFDCHEKDLHIYRMLFGRKFKVPFGETNNECPKCSGKISYISGSHQYLGRHAHFRQNCKGWLHTKNQYLCSNCDHYIVFVQRTFVFINSGHHVLIVNKSRTNKSAKPALKKIKQTYRKPKPTYKWIKTEDGEWGGCVQWDGTCMSCKTETIPQKEYGAGSVTGKSSLLSDSICPECYLVHHAEEHDD